MDTLDQALQRYRAADAAHAALLDMGADVRRVGPYAYLSVHGPTLRPQYTPCPECNDLSHYWPCASCGRGVSRFCEFGHSSIPGVPVS
jgi:hypothetical protein